MSSGSWTNSDGLYLQFGTTKATVETGGEFRMPGANRVLEVDINLANLTTSSANATTPVVISNTAFFPAGQNIQIERCELLCVNGTTTTCNLSLGLVQDDRTTIPSTGGQTAFVNAVTSSTISTAGDIISFTAGTASAGGLIGNYEVQWNTNAQTSGSSNSVGGYLTANLGSATSGVGLYRARIFYHGVGTIAY